MGRAALLLMAMLIAGCDEPLDHGKCLNSMSMPYIITMVQAGNVLVPIYGVRNTCVQWEFPEGRATTHNGEGE